MKCPERDATQSFHREKRGEKHKIKREEEEEEAKADKPSSDDLRTSMV